MSDESKTFDCPVARKSVTFTISVPAPAADASPAPTFKSCTGLATCGVEERFRNGVTLHWELCPAHRGLG